MPFSSHRRAALAGLVLAGLFSAPAAAAAPTAAATAGAAKQPRTPADILRDAPASAWRRADPNDVLAMTLPSGTVWIELARRFAPHHAANIGALVAQHYFDGLAVLRVQDNFVAQWGDPDADSAVPGRARSLGAAAPKLPPEFSIADAGLKIARMKDRDVWAPVTGFVDGFPVGADPKTHRAWVAHCYGTVGAGRGDAVDSANGAELYAVIGQSPRGLDLNITPVGRVLQGMELLSSLPRGGANMGFYDQPDQRVRITKIERLADMPAASRPDVWVFRTDTPQWAELVESRRNRPDRWYVHKAGAIDVCNLTAPVRIDAKPGGLLPAPAASAGADAASIAQGRRLVLTGHCNNCHTAGYANAFGQVPEARWLTGNPVGWRGKAGTVYASNLRLAMQAWSEDAWLTRARSSEWRAPMPWWSLRDYSDDELRALYRYVRSLAPAGEPAPAFLPPDHVPPRPYNQLPDLP